MIYIDPGLAILALIVAVVLGVVLGVVATLLWAVRLVVPIRSRRDET